MSKEAKLKFTISDHNPDTESCFSFKSRKVGEDSMETEIEFYGGYENIVNTFIALFNDSEETRELLCYVMNGLTINRISTELGMRAVGEDEESPNEERPEPKKENNENDGFALSS